jgi:hypothetical protein
MTTRDPWLTTECGQQCRTIDAQSRLAEVRAMTSPSKLQAVIDWPDTQKTVRRAAERRLRNVTRCDRAACTAYSAGHCNGSHPAQCFERRVGSQPINPSHLRDGAGRSAR